MIIGIGSDFVDIRRIEKLIERYGERFIARIYTDAERAKAAKRRNPAPTYAKRFAAKEACSKALGTGIHQGVYFHDMGVVNLPSGQPTLQLTGGALERLKKLVPRGMTSSLHLTITDEVDWAQAFVIIEATEPVTQLLT
jgi:holo-[acyl-carrier protein] synthase